MQIGGGAVEIAELVPLALVIALSPLSVIPGILMLHTPRPRPTSLAFLLGWTLGIGAITAAFVAASDLAGGLDKTPSWAAYVRIVVGSALIVFGVYRWLTRNRSQHTPKWLTSMTSAGPGRAFATATILTVANVKVLLMCAAAGATIGTAALGRTGSWVAALTFTAIAVSSVAIPVLGYLIVGERLDAPLNRLRTWMENNHGGLVAGILLVIGVAVLYKGIHAL
ncbi:MAG: GAP family protein [Mycobacterium sp.]|nr:GAP family protein [Mycobacterium sp.]